MLQHGTPRRDTIRDRWEGSKTIAREVVLNLWSSSYLRGSDQNCMQHDSSQGLPRAQGSRVGLVPMPATHACNPSFSRRPNTLPCLPWRLLMPFHVMPAFNNVESSRYCYRAHRRIELNHGIYSGLRYCSLTSSCALYAG